MGAGYDAFVLLVDLSLVMATSGRQATWTDFLLETMRVGSAWIMGGSSKILPVDGEAGSEVPPA